MAGVYKLDIQEEAAELKELLRQQKEAFAKERIQCLYLLKTDQAQTLTQAAQILGRNRVTVQKWAKKYREGGMIGLLERKQSTGRPCQLPEWAEKALEKRLQDEEGFRSYHEIGEWLEENVGILAPYKTVYYWAHYRLKASPKVVRPRSSQQDIEQREEFKKKLCENLAMVAFFTLHILKWDKKIRFFCGDESRFGLKTITGRKITQQGVKPVGKVQWPFKATYLYGIIEPATGDSFFYEFTHCDTDCFEAFLALVSQHYPDDIIIIQLDNAAWHKAKRLGVPKNIILMFQPPYCPELNPIEQVWQYLKKRLRWLRPSTLDDLRELIRQQLELLEKSTVASIAGRKSILKALSVAGIL